MTIYKYISLVEDDEANAALYSKPSSKRSDHKAYFEIDIER